MLMGKLASKPETSAVTQGPLSAKFGKKQLSRNRRNLKTATSTITYIQSIPNIFTWSMEILVGMVVL